MTVEFLGDPKMGIMLFKGVIAKELDYGSRLEKVLKNSSHPYFRWNEALVGEGTKMPEYRDCVDFKFDHKYINNTPSDFAEVIEIYSDIADVQRIHLNYYQSKYNINMTYMEAINFVKYGPDQHFSVHTDHGFSYVCTVSSILYLNDNYDGGELWFPHLDIKWKPGHGDLVFFPSTYIYAHAALPVTSGHKYSAVTMYDYNDDTHKYGGFTRDFGQSNNQPYEPSINQSALAGPITPQEFITK